MRSIPHAGRKANSNLRGKKTRLATCKCCMWQDFREDYWRKMAKNEIRKAFKRT